MRLPRLPPDSVTRSTVAGVDRRNFAQPPWSGPAVALVWNHTSWAVIQTCAYCAGVLPVTDTSVRVEQAASAQHRPAIQAASTVRFIGKSPGVPSEKDDLPSA